MVTYATNDGTQVYVTKSYDATSHFESTCHDVLDIFKSSTGQEFDFSKVGGRRRGGGGGRRNGGGGKKGWGGYRGGEVVLKGGR